MVPDTSDSEIGCSHWNTFLIKMLFLAENLLVADAAKYNRCIMFSLLQREAWEDIMGSVGSSFCASISNDWQQNPYIFLIHWDIVFGY